MSMSSYKLERHIYTPAGIKVYNNYQEVDLNFIDTQVEELETCLNISINRSCFAILIPDDWFISQCSGQQMLPVTAPYEQCAIKGLYLPEECRGLSRPTENCPCVCTYRVALQDDYIVVTPPALRLMKVDLARLVTNVNDVFSDPLISKCLAY